MRQSSPRQSIANRQSSIAIAEMCAAFLLLALPALAQSGRLQGIVTDEQGRPVAGAAVEVVAASGVAGRTASAARSGTRRTSTDEHGAFVVPNLAGGEYQVLASKDGAGTGRASGVLGVAAFAVVTVTLRRSVSGPDQACAPQANAYAPMNVFAAYPGSAPLVHLARWLDAVQLHSPGCVDRSAADVATWSREDFKILLQDVGRLSSFLQKMRNIEAQDPVGWQQRRAEAAARRKVHHISEGDRDNPKPDVEASLTIHGELFVLDEVERIFQGSDTVKRGAVLHADIAALVGDHLGQRSVVVDDGRRKGGGGASIHWEVGRRLLDLLPDAGEDADVRRWYRATSAYLIGTHRLAEAPAQLERARQLFPDDAAFQLDSGYLHEKLASPEVQAAVHQLDAAGTPVLVQTASRELERAEGYFRRAVALAGENPDARLHHGRALGELGRHQDAAAELRRAADIAREPRQRYLARLFLGREEEALGDTVAASRSFAEAAALYPHAQSPRLAMARLARERGDPQTALRELQVVVAPVDPPGEDPWRLDYEPHLQDSTALWTR